MPIVVEDLRLSGVQHVPTNGRKVVVVIPSYRVRAHILGLLARIGPEVAEIFVVDDTCPDGSGQLVLDQCHDPRVTVLTHERNQGVGGAVITGYRCAVAAGADVIVKVDGDGQMDPALIPQFVAPILNGSADYVKGNRFYSIEELAAMPRARLIGNAGLSFVTKISSGYWTLFDPTNGYTAISSAVLSHLPLHLLERRYFFESDILFRLSTVQAVVLDLPMKPIYADEQSGLKIGRIIFPFIKGNINNCIKRIFYGYFLRGFSVASLELIVGLLFIAFGTIFGAERWRLSIATGVPATTGTVMLAALPVFLGVQFLLSFLAFDTAAVPVRPVTPLLIPREVDSARLPQVRSELRCGMKNGPSATGPGAAAQTADKITK